MSTRDCCGGGDQPTFSEESRWLRFSRGKTVLRSGDNRVLAVHLELPNQRPGFSVQCVEVAVPGAHINHTVHHGGRGADDVGRWEGPDLLEVCYVAWIDPRVRIAEAVAQVPAVHRPVLLRSRV